MRNRILFSLLGTTLALAALFATGCSSTRAGRTSLGGGHDEASGSKLWAQNCARCHNVRSPDAYTDAQWEVATMHMRIRANLTAQEHHAIVEFLKSAN
jgi:mono/diheme cytochrome c family protein